MLPPFLGRGQENKSKNFRRGFLLVTRGPERFKFFFKGLEKKVGLIFLKLEIMSIQ